LPNVERISIVLAQWCPHCVPLSRDYAARMSRELSVPLRVLDIDNSDQAAVADEMVKRHGDYVEDYIIPQVFAEFSDGSVQHVLTGSSEGTEVTRARWENLLRSAYYEKLGPSRPLARESFGR
jgi:glutaredoxin